MAKQTINVGTTANDKKGDSLRAAFQKVNANFTELYTQLGLVNDPTLSLGAFEFTGSTMSTTDSTAITIDQPTTITSDLTVGGDIVPSVAQGGDLGSLSKPWKSLYVSNNTVYLGGVPLSLDPGTNSLKVNNVPVSQTIVYEDIPNAPPAFSGSYNDLTNKPTIPEDVSDLTDTGGLLGGGTADLTITVPGDTYKGFGARYGRVYSNGSPSELTVSKLVIFKETAVTASTISLDSDIDNFAVTGLGNSDVVAMFVLFGDTNGEKSVDTLKTFARAAIDNVILAGGVEGSINTIAAMRSAFYANIATLTSASGGLVANFEFFNYQNQFQVNFDESGQGSGTGFDLTQLSYNLQTGQPEVSGWGNGTGYTQGDQIVIPGTSITYEGTPLLSPDNDITITLTDVNQFGQILNLTASGTLPPPPAQWPANYINDGGLDQYDGGNYINTNLAQQISYNNGVIVEDATTEFGAGSKYVVVYDSSIFGVFATGSSATQISTSGGSGADGSSTTDTGEVFVNDRTYDPALTDLTLINNPLKATPVTFVKLDNATANDVDVIEDDSTLQIGITRGDQRGIYNPFTEEGWDQNVSPQGTLWSVGNTDDLSDVTLRTYTNFYAAYGNGQLGNRVPGSKAIMYVPSIEKYYLIEWISWTQGGNGSGFSYTRTEIDVAQVSEGIQFADGTRLKSAAGLGRVKSTAGGNRRIEEVVGSKTVSFTQFAYTTVTGVTTRAETNTNRIYVARPGTVFDVADNYNLYVQNPEDMEFSLDNINWYRWDGSGSLPDGEYGYGLLGNPILTYNQGDTVYLRYQSGGLPVVWWDKADLPGGSADFRGAVIDYHAYSGEATWIGTIHIVDDTGNNHISHTEVSSGSTDAENDDLWLVAQEGQIKYRRIDGEAKTLKVHWTAKVFYGSEFWD